MKAKERAGPQTVIDLLDDSVRRYPERTAIEFGPLSITYAELDRQRTAFAGDLSRGGIRAGDRLLLVSENSIDYVVALFGSLSVGAVVVPLAPETPAEKAKLIANLTEARAILATPLAQPRLAPVCAPRLVALLGKNFAEGAEASVSEPLPPLTGGSRAMVLFTSGSSSSPKGVVLTHANLVANVTAVVTCLNLACRDSVVSVLPFYYSFGNSVLLTHLAAGATVVIENRFAYPEVVVEALAQRRPTGFYGVPATFYILLGRTTFAKRDWGFLRYVGQAGGAMRTETIRRLRGLLPETDIFIMYGQTEASARLTVLPPDEVDSRPASVGKPIPGMEIRVVDPTDHEVPPGQPGELVARGSGVMEGYLNDPDGTRNALRGGWLHTGDIARTDDNGFLYVIGRSSDFIKSASVRVSPAEIEEVVAEIGGVEDVAAFGVEDPLLGEAIAVSIVGDPARVNPAEVQKHCASRLQPHKVPKYVFLEAEIPHTANGKKQYFRLREKHRVATGSPSG